MKETVLFLPNVFLQSLYDKVRARWYERNGLAGEGQEGNLLSRAVGAIANKH